MVLKASKFFCICYADDISEKEFFAKSFSAMVEKDVLELSFKFVRGLDTLLVKENLLDFTFYEIEDMFLKNKLIRLLNSLPQVKRIKLSIEGSTIGVKQLKLTHKGFVIRLV